jgi:hypothetical protein|tara:strand:+ start:116 stop:481 length:366 start_codon:yes stop_codon:yes gene_type:complete
MCILHPREKLIDISLECIQLDGVQAETLQVIDLYTFIGVVFQHVYGIIVVRIELRKKVMKAIELVKMAEKFAALEENIEKGAVNWDFVGADIFWVLRVRGIEVDAELVEVALVAASLEGLV